jgi:hypothetical protein
LITRIIFGEPLYCILLYYIQFPPSDCCVTDVPFTSLINVFYVFFLHSPKRRSRLLKQVARGVGPKQLQPKASPHHKLFLWF